MSRTKRLSKADEMMRRDGLVTAVEVKVKQTRSRVERDGDSGRGIDEGRIPGKSVQVSEKIQPPLRLIS